MNFVPILIGIYIGGFILTLRYGRPLLVRSVWDWARASYPGDTIRIIRHERSAWTLFALDVGSFCLLTLWPFYPVARKAIERSLDDCFEARAETRKEPRKRFLFLPIIIPFTILCYVASDIFEIFDRRTRQK
jgi:hypothetical protein